MANLMAMTVARDVHLAALRDTAGTAPRGAALEGVRVYVSDQAHFSIRRALDVLGFPAGTLRVLPSDDGFCLRAEPVAEAIRADRAAGLTPLAIAAVAGSTNTGAVDDVPALAELADLERLWLHVDAAYGGAARLSPREASKVPGLELADSVTVDPHKWFFQAYDVGGLVVRRREDLHRTFTMSPEYYRAPRPEEQPLDWYQYSLEGTRRFRALKLWTSWKHLGTTGLAALVERNVDLALYLVEALRAKGFEVVDPALSIVCFRWPGGDDAAQDALQRALEESGEGWVSTTVLRGRTFLRAGVVNYLTARADADRVVEALARHALALA
jgi:glutamate/tyrosine decarboxylase-like PLP-dependent enzyme